MFDSNENTPISNRKKDSVAMNLLTDLEGDIVKPVMTMSMAGGQRDEASWREEVNMWIQQCEKLQNAANSARLERERQSNTIDDLMRDQTSLNARISAMILEHREVKNHWLAEKADLQSRLCQVQALNTQIGGTLKKKEKDFDKLQAQMAKLVKDANKAQKSTIQITTPLKKSLSQDQSNPVVQQLLKDAEVVALRSTIKSMEVENNNLKSSTQQMAETIKQLQMALVEEAKNHVPMISNDVPSLTEKDTASPIHCVPSTPIVESTVEVVPVAGSIAKKYLVGTPAAPSIEAIVDHVNTEVKSLRKRSQDNNNDYGMTPNVQGKIASLRSKLSEAMAVIQEQDRLIQQALLGSLPVNNSSDVVAWEVDEIDDDCYVKQSTVDNASEDLMNWAELDFLPPASPETVELMKGYGWNVPRISSAQQSRRSTRNGKELLTSIQEEATMAPEQLEY